MLGFSRVALGTVQFGLDYGLTNTQGIPSDQELQEILNVASEGGITKLDTATAYGNSEERIGLSNNNRFEIITKISNIIYPESITESVERSLLLTKQPSLYAVMFHNTDEVINNPTFWEELKALRTKGKIKKIGCSLYNVSQLLSLFDLGIVPDIVQIPMSIVDRSFESHLAVMKSKSIEIHARSIFLQGLLLSKEMRSKKRFKQWTDLWTDFDQWRSDVQINELEACVNHVLSYPEIDAVVVGVTTAKELKEILSSISTNPRRAPDTLNCVDKNLLFTLNWPKD